MRHGLPSPPRLQRPPQRLSEQGREFRSEFRGKVITVAEDGSLSNDRWANHSGAKPWTWVNERGV